MLTRLGFETAALDAKLLTQHALGLDSLALALREQDPVGEAQAEAVARLLQRRMSGESVARIIGEREFYGLGFALNAATLEPRPDTELLVDLALGALPAGGRLLDLGTGTGCIPIAILANQPDASGVAVDLSAEALAAAALNAARHGVAERLVLLQGSWFEALGTAAFRGGDGRLGAGEAAFSLSVDQNRPPHPALRADLSPEGRGEESGGAAKGSGEGEGRFDVIVSNPPYIASDIVETLAAEVKDFDPRLALDGGPDGLAPYRIIAAEAPKWLRPDGHLLVEIGYDQGAAVSALLLEAGFADVAVHRDLGGQDRVVWAQGLG